MLSNDCPKEIKVNDQEYSYLKEKIYKTTGLDVSCYKTQQMRRRLEAYILKNKYPSVAVFCTVLEKSPDKQRELLDYMAINVSEFFRDMGHFQTLQNIILPQLLEDNRRLNIWSAACSCGQEPYTLAMILEELKPGFHRILATDIDESAMKQARNGGPYIPYDVRNVPKNILEKYFVQDGAGYWVNEAIKRKVIFQRRNLLEDTFERNYDLIVCRNVIIYFSEPVRDQLYQRFHQSLKPNGILFLGGSEVVLRPGEQGFNMLRPSFYRKIENHDNKVSRSFVEVTR
jgi:chemotaxis protein methyltransferase CheR